MRKTIPQKWDIETDVVVVGYGCAGATAAITASDEGAAVTILEKMPAGGGNTRISGGGWLTPTDVGFAEYVETLCGGLTEREVIRTFVKKAMGIGEWVKSVGGEARVFKPAQVSYVAGPFPGASFPWLPGSQHMLKMKLKEPADDGEGLWKFFTDTVEKRPIRVMLNTRAEELILNEKGEVAGVMARKEGGQLFIKARRGVILTTGGFGRDEEAKRDFLPCRPFFDFGNPANTGDGIRLAQKVGAALWHMPATSAALGFKTPEYDAAFCISFKTERFIFVNRDCRRFVDETGLEDHEIAAIVSTFDARRWSYPNIPAYGIFDETGRKKAPLFEGNSGFNRTLYKWSPDSSIEIEKGWVIKGNTIAELARKIKLNEAGLEQGLSQYAGYCRTGKDEDFGRAGETLVPLDTPPYYAIELYPCLCNTQGGPRRDSESRVLDPDGEPIPRLYAAGELGSIWGFIYQGGGNNAECIVFGQIAGSNAAAEKPWDDSKGNARRVVSCIGDRIDGPNARAG
ncbi:MAG: FAD-binding protein [Chloroflexi bacterium]|nr:FAD-binding protein [Chloroflexota bacterium]